MNDSLLEVESIYVGYGDVEVLHGVSLEVREKEVVTLLGSNGAGKTTTLRAIAGLRVPKRGEIRYRGSSLLALPASARPEVGISLVPEGRELWSHLTVLENLELGAYTPKVRSRVRQNLDRVFALFPRLEERRRQLAGSLSGGEQQMCAIGRALMSEPQLLILDEPSLGLAPIMTNQVFRSLLELRNSGLTLLLVEQNLKKALEIADRGYVIETGRIRLSGTSRELSNNDSIRTAYLGL